MTKKTRIIKYCLFAALFLCLIGIAIYSGLKNGRVRYYEIQSDAGFSFEDISLVSTLPSVKNAYAVVNKMTDSKDPVTVHSLSDNQIDLIEGRIPANDKEVLIGSGFAASYVPGDFISLNHTKYKVTGIFDNETNEGFQVYCLPAALYGDTITYMGVEIYGDKSLEELLGECIDDLYRNRQADNERNINQLEDKRSLIQDVSSDELISGKEKLEDASASLSDGEERIQDYEEQIADGERDRASFEQLLSEGLTQLDDGKRKLDDAKTGIEKAERELSSQLEQYGYSVDDLAAAEQSIRDYEKQIKDAESELAYYKKELNKGAKTLENARILLNDAKTEIEKGRSQLNAELEKYGFTMDDLLSAEKTIQDYADSYGVTKEELYEIASRYEDYEKYIVALKDRSAELAELLKNRQDEYDEAYNARIEAAYTKVREYYEKLRGAFIHSSIDLSIDSMEAIRQECEKLIAFFQDASAVRQLIENEDKIAEALETYRLIQDSQKKYDAKNREYLTGLETYREEKSGFNEAQEKLKTARKEFEEKKELVQKAVDANNQIKASRKEYDEKYNEYLTGLDTYYQQKANYDSAVSELDAARNEVNKAKDELASGRSEYERAKQEYDEAAAGIDDEINAISEEIKQYEGIRHKLEASWNTSDCIKVVYEKSALLKSILIVVLAYAAFILGCTIIRKVKTKKSAR